MSIQIRRLHPLLVGEISGVDSSLALEPASVEASPDAINRYAVLEFHDQVLNDAKPLAFAANSGGLSKPRYSYGKQRIDPRSISSDGPFPRGELCSTTSSSMRLNGGLSTGTAGKSVNWRSGTIAARCIAVVRTL